MRELASILFVTAVLPPAGRCAPIIVPNLPAVACHDSRLPATWRPDRYTPGGYENVGGIFGMGSVLSVNPLICDFDRVQRRGDEFPYYEAPRAGGFRDPEPDPPIPGFYVWLYLPDLQPGGFLRGLSANRQPLELALTGSPLKDPDDRPALYDAVTLIALTMPGAASVAAVPRRLPPGRMLWYAAGTTTALASPGHARLLVERGDAGLGFSAAAARLERSLGGPLRSPEGTLGPVAGW